MPFEFQVWLLVSVSIIMQWLLIGNDFLNYYSDHEYFYQLQQLQEGENKNVNRNQNNCIIT